MKKILKLLGGSLLIALGLWVVSAAVEWTYVTMAYRFMRAYLFPEGIPGELMAIIQNLSEGVTRDSFFAALTGYAAYVVWLAISLRARVKGPGRLNGYRFWWAALGFVSMGALFVLAVFVLPNFSKMGSLYRYLGGKILFGFHGGLGLMIFWWCSMACTLPLVDSVPIGGAKLFKRVNRPATRKEA